VKERKDRVDDAMHATRAAVEEGIVPAAASALLYALKALEKLKPTNDDQKVGIEIVRGAAGAGPPDRRERRRRRRRRRRQAARVEGRVLRLRRADGEYGDMVKAGIIDPTKVVRTRCRTRPRSPAC
jgi:chaperonin GroEL